MMNIEIKKMETDEEIRGKAYVHWKSWHEAFTGLIENKYIDGLTIEKCEEWGFRWPENTLVAKDGGAMEIVEMKRPDMGRFSRCMFYPSIMAKALVAN